MESGHTAALFHSESWWPSCGKVSCRVFELWDEIRVLFKEEDNEFAHKFIDDNYLMKIAYKCNIFQKLNALNLQMQGSNSHFPCLTDKLRSVTRKLGMWE